MFRQLGTPSQIIQVDATSEFYRLRATESDRADIKVYLLCHEMSKNLESMTRHDLFRALRNKNFALACVFGLIALAHGLADYEPGISLRVAHLPPFYINAYDAFI